MSASWWAVEWTCDGLSHLFDTDNGGLAHEIAWQLAERGREDVHVTEMEVAIPPEAERRVRERIMRALASEQSIARMEAAR